MKSQTAIIVQLYEGACQPGRIWKVQQLCASQPASELFQERLSSQVLVNPSPNFFEISSGWLGSCSLASRSRIPGTRERERKLNSRTQSKDTRSSPSFSLNFAPINSLSPSFAAQVCFRILIEKNYTAETNLRKWVRSKNVVFIGNLKYLMGALNICLSERPSQCSYFA